MRSIVAVVVLLCVTGSCVGRSPSDGKGVGLGMIYPSYTNISKHPSTVAIVSGLDLVGGGVLVKPRWVLTAANVTHGLNETDINVRVASNNPFVGGHLYRVAKIIEHPSYKTNNSYNFALLKLGIPVNRTIAKPIKYLARIPFQGTNTYGNITGFGQQFYGNSYGGSQSQLQISKMLLYNSTNCNYNWNYIYVPSVQICGASDSDTTLCYGDAGDPLTKCVSEGVCELIGINTGANLCYVGYPSTFMDVGQFHSWIQHTMSHN